MRVLRLVCRGCFGVGGQHSDGSWGCVLDEVSEYASFTSYESNLIGQDSR